MAEPIERPDIALMQLDRAVDLYLAGGSQNLVCAITLAGAAEEILGRLVIKQGGIPSLHETLDMLCGMHKAAFPDDEPSRKAYADLRNKAKTDFKHITDSEPFRGNLEREARNMIRRAMTNHRKLGAGFAEKYWRFEKEMLERERASRP
jgi:hypothetical protein